LTSVLTTRSICIHLTSAGSLAKRVSNGSGRYLVPFRARHAPKNVNPMNTAFSQSPIHTLPTLRNKTPFRIPDAPVPASVCNVSARALIESAVFLGRLQACRDLLAQVHDRHAPLHSISSRLELLHVRLPNRFAHTFLEFQALEPLAPLPRNSTVTGRLLAWRGTPTDAG
jgi:hypothetical protein